MSALRTRRHATTAREHVALRWGVAGVIGVALMSVFTPIFIGATALADIETADVTLLLGPDRPAPPPPPTDEAKGQIVNILLMGSDVRDGSNGQIGGEVSGMRNDTTLLLHISADRTRMEFMSIPRDSLVRIPDCELSDGTIKKGWTGKFNIAFANGGIEGSASDAAACTIRAVEGLTGIPITGYAVIDFTGFIEVIDALGGVPMCIPGHIVSGKAALDLQAGPQILSGWQALAWARLRTAEVGKEWVNGSDLQRIDRQHELLSKVFEVAVQQNLFLKWNKLADLFEAVASSLTTSPELADFDYLKGLAWSIRHIDKANVVFTTVPWKYTPDYLDVTWTADARVMFDSIIADLPIAGTSVADSSDAAPAPNPSASDAVIPPPEQVDLVGACSVAG